MVQAKQPRPATYQDLLELPENVVGEIIGGELHVQPRPAGPHAFASSRLGAVLGPISLGSDPSDWLILDEPELHLGPRPDVLVPDLAGWRGERRPPLSEAAFTLAPDWICEVLSPKTSVKDRAKKLPIYAREEVGHAWLIDPLVRSVDVFRREGAYWQLLATHSADERVRAEPFVNLEIDLSLLWAP